jgi:hypothetical protein
VPATSTPHCCEAKELLRRLADADERSLRLVMAPTPEFLEHPPLAGLALDRRIRVLVRLAALLATDASTESLRWAVELASSTGADDDALVAALVAAGSAAGAAQVVASAPRLGLALGFDIDTPGA